MYKLYPLVNGIQVAVLKLDNNLSIPFVEGNTDYQAFLAWCAEGNTPIPADE